MHITSLEVENVKRIRAVSITPDGQSVVIGGENEQGKSSLLDSFAMALGGADEIPDKPLRNGTKKGHIICRLSGDPERGLQPLVIERRFTEKGTQLIVKSPDGLLYTSPQKMLDTFYSHISFDPMEFAHKKATEQAELLRKLIGLDFTGLETERARLFAERTIVNRETKSLEARAEALPYHATAPAAEVSVADLMEEQKRRLNVNSDNHRERAKIEELQSVCFRDQTGIERVDLEIHELEQKLQDKRQYRSRLIVELDAAKKALAEHAVYCEALKDEDVDEIRQQIVDSQATNARVRENATRAALLAEMDASAEKAGRLTEQINEIDQEKAAQLAAVKWPIDGLGFNDDGHVTLDGLPLDQASESKRILTSVAIGMRLNPKLQVLLIRNGNDLGAKRLAEVLQMADEQGYQLLIERVSQGSECSVIIEDGAVKAAEAVGAAC